MKAPVLVLDESRAVADGLAALGVDFDLASVDEFDHALEQARQSPPVAIVLSADLERGYAFCRRIKKDPMLSGVRVVLTSIRKTPEEFQNHAQLPTRADTYLLAPFGPEALREALQLPDVAAVSQPAELELDPFTLQETTPVADPAPSPASPPAPPPAPSSAIPDYDFSAFDEGDATRLATAQEASLLDAFDPPAREPPPPSASALARELEEISFDILDPPVFTSSDTGRNPDVLSSVAPQGSPRGSPSVPGLTRPSRGASVAQRRDDGAWDMSREVHAAEDDWQLEGALGTDHPAARAMGSESGLRRTVPVGETRPTEQPRQVARLDATPPPRSSPERSYSGLGSFGPGFPGGGVPSGLPSRARSRPAPEAVGGRALISPGLASTATSRTSSATATTLDALQQELQGLLARLEAERNASRAAEAAHQAERERYEADRPELEAQNERLRERLAAQEAELTELRSLYSDALSTLEATAALLAQPLAAITRHEQLRASIRSSPDARSSDSNRLDQSS
ncbi:MAG: hypothetical protein IV100_23705 [Myxococcales bacterium]|nr:hypothetical protein [Myxococcales bacterium]